MAIINAKRLEADEEAERNARQQAEEYASRNDTSWQQPPPAYEEAAGQSSSSTPGPSRSINQANLSSTQDQEDIAENEVISREERREQRRKRQRSTRFMRGESDEDSEEVDERTALLSNRRKRELRKKKKFIGKLIAGLLLLAILVLMIINLFRNDNESKQMPKPWPSDGIPIEDPNWSPIEKTPKDSWKSPLYPEYSRISTFSFPANASLAFIRAHGSSYSGLIRTGSAEEISKEEWKRIHGGQELDRIAVVIEARFTQQYLLDRIRINKMVEKRNKNYYGEGISVNADHIPMTGQQLLYLNINVLLPGSDYRSPSGLARDNSSFIPALDIYSDNLRVVHEGFAFKEPSDEGEALSVSFGTVTSIARAGGMSLGMPVVANESVSMRVESGSIRDIYYTEPFPIIVAAPKVDIITVSGPIWITGVVGVESIDLRAIAGGLNVSHIAVAKDVSVTTRDGILGGRYSAFDSFNVQTTSADLRIEMVVNQRAYFDSLKKSGLLGILNIEKVEEIQKEIKKKSSHWRKLFVEAKTKNGALYVKYVDQDERTQLISNISSIVGSVKVSHPSNFQGEYQIRTKLGSVLINEPSSDRPGSEKHFEIVDPDPNRGGWEKFIKGKLWFKRFRWEDGGSERSSLFPISNSNIVSNIGTVKVEF